MKHIHFIYGNQPFEIEEEANSIIQKLIPAQHHQDAVFTFDIEDFYSKDQNQNRKLLGDFKNTCQTVSFFSPVVLVHLKNVQNLLAKKKKKEPLSKELDRIVLIKKDIGGESEWIDADTVIEPAKTHLKLTGKHIIKNVSHLSGNSYSMILDPSWKNREIYLQRGSDLISVSVKEFLSFRLKVDLEFIEDDTEYSSNTEFSDDIFTLISDYLRNPPEQVELILSANIKNTRELSQEIFSQLKSNANVIKKTISYDDFRPVSWVIERARAKQLNMNSTTADLLIEIAGSDYSVLNMELEKLSVLYPSGQSLLPELLFKSVSQSKNFTVFKISDSLLNKELKDSLESLGSLLGNHSAETISIFALIATQFRRALKISWMLAQDIPEKLIIENLGMNQWIARQLIKQVENFTTNELENLLVYLAKCDIQLKYSAKDAGTLLENICFLICQNEFRKVSSIKSSWIP